MLEYNIQDHGSFYDLERAKNEAADIAKLEGGSVLNVWEHADLDTPSKVVKVYQFDENGEEL